MQNRGNKARDAILIAAAAFFLCLPISVRAANIWDGGGTDNNWGTAANWDNNLVPTFPSAITFGSSSRLSPNNNLTNVTVNGITFSNSRGYLLTGNAITLAGNITNNTAGPQTIDLPMALGAGTTIDGGPFGVTIDKPISGT